MLLDAVLTLHKLNGIPGSARFSHGCRQPRPRQKSSRSFLIFFDAYAPLLQFTKWKVKSVLNTLGQLHLRAIRSQKTIGVQGMIQ